MKLEAVILDWAGTTVDFGCFAPVQAFLDGFAAFGIHPTLEEVRAPMGLLKWDHIHTMMQMPRISAEWEAVHDRPWTREDVDAIYQAPKRCCSAPWPGTAPRSPMCWTPWPSCAAGASSSAPPPASPTR